MVHLDEYDLKLLKAVQQDARASNVELSDRVLLSPSQCSRRLARLEEIGVIAAYHAAVSPEKVGLSVSAYVQVVLKRHDRDAVDRFRQALNNLPQILEAYAITGDADFILKVVATDLKSLSGYLMDHILMQDAVGTIRSNIMLDCIKKTPVLPIRVRGRGAD